MDTHFHLNGADFVWDTHKAASNAIKHGGVTFEQAASVFFDPFLRLVDASRNDEARDAVVGFDAQSRLLFVVHVQMDDAFIRIISARKATALERREHEHS
ncbi:BrnT family toxin [Amphibiibacter pelophylacis]|uniref:BrnT family toxin n=1 Tax=Amphibiibacter pelophylacis TaxID=1799477 RepID=A0ACC6NYI3_9BURK